MSKYKRYYLSSTPVFITIVTQYRKPWLVDHAEVVLACIHRVKKKYHFRHIAHVLLPDHMHLIIEPISGSNFSKIIAAIKRDVSWRMKETGCYAGWQKRFYDHMIRDDFDMRCHLDYIHYNPVKHGLVNDPFEYPYSSLKEWLKRGVYEISWGSVEPDGLKTMGLE